MISNLIISDLALIHNAEFEFSPGFICFTGETGAGKSVLLGALKILTGNRVERFSIRDNAEKCTIEGLFDVKTPEIDKFLQDNDLPACDGGLIIKRVVGKKGSQKISINGSLATVNVLKALGKLLIEFNDPTEPQKLFEQKFQIELLDEFANLSSDCLQYKELFDSLKALKAEREEFLSTSILSEDGIEFVKSQLLEFDGIELTEESIDKLESEFQKISKRDICLESLSSITKCFESENSGINYSMIRLRNEFQKFVTHWPDAEHLFERIENVFVELQDIESTCYDQQAQFESSDSRDKQIIQKFETLLLLKRKYGNFTKSLIVKRKELETQLITAQNYSNHLEQFNDKIKEQEALCTKLANELHQKRAATIGMFADKIVEQLKNLGFKKPIFTVALHKLDTLSAYGLNTVEFLFSSDEIIKPAPIAKIASSGEMARILLALKTVFKQSSTTPIIVFDEIDANVGGEIGTMVGKQLKALAETAQVFCVTHLPQVASQASQHVSVKKISDNNSVNILFESLNTKDKRLIELARMLGDSTSTSAKQHAVSMLS